jgi:hypothetical protein
VAVNTDQTLTVTAVDHGLDVGDLVIIDGAGSLGGLDADVINTQWAVATVPDDDTFTVELPDAATSNETGGGDSVTIQKPNKIFAHEVGFSADGENLNAYIESGDTDIEDGDSFWFVTRMVPDVEYRGDPTVAELDVTMTTRDFPGSDPTTPVNVTIMEGTTQKHIRLRGRQMAYKVESNGVGFGWRLGKFRFNVRQDGRR